MNVTIQLDSSKPSEQPVQVWLVDDNDQLRGLIADTLERQGRIACTRQFDNPNGLLSTLASRTGPDVILLDVQMGEFNGLDALPSIKSLAQQTRVYMLTTFFDPGWYQQAMDCGASGYHLKSDSLERLVESIRDRSPVGPPVWRRRRRPVCARPQMAGSANPAGSAVQPEPSQPGKSRVVLDWLKRFAMG
jgi:DNA-binding NtrC family response regulator